MVWQSSHAPSALMRARFRRALRGIRSDVENEVAVSALSGVTLRKLFAADG